MDKKVKLFISLVAPFYVYVRRRRYPLVDALQEENKKNVRSHPFVFLRTLGKVIFELALRCNKSSPVHSSNKKTEKARCNIPLGYSLLQTWDSLLLAEPMTLSFRSKAKTVSFSIISDWLIARPFQTIFLTLFSATMVLACRTKYLTSCLMKGVGVNTRKRSVKLREECGWL